MIPRLGGVTLSVLLHVGVLAVLLAWSTADWTRPLFVDLVEHPDSAREPATGPLARSPHPATRAARTGMAASAVEPRSEPLPPPAPSAHLLAAVAPPVEPVAPMAPPPPVVAAEPTPPPAPSVAPLPTPPVLPASAAPSVADGRRGAPEAGAGPVARGGGPVRGDAEPGPGGAPGSPLARATPGPGGAGGVAPEYGPYLRRFRQRVLESLIYPLAARRRGLAGTVELHVWIESTGRVRDVQIARSSSHDVLDDAAVETIRRLGPVPFPDSVPRRALLIRIPLVFELR